MEQLTNYSKEFLYGFLCAMTLTTILMFLIIIAMIPTIKEYKRTRKEHDNKKKETQ